MTRRTSDFGAQLDSLSDMVSFGLAPAVIALQAVIALLSKTLRAPKGAFTLVAGATDRNKIIDVAGDPADLLARLRLAAGMEDGHG